MSTSSRSARLRPDTERWLQELTKDLPPDLIDPRELEDVPEDPFKKRLQTVLKAEDNLDDDMDTPLSSADADLLDAATEEQPPTPRKAAEVKRASEGPRAHSKTQSAHGACL